MVGQLHQLTELQLSEEMGHDESPCPVRSSPRQPRFPIRFLLAATRPHILFLNPSIETFGCHLFLLCRRVVYHVKDCSIHNSDPLYRFECISQNIKFKYWYETELGYESGIWISIPFLKSQGCHK